MRPHRVAFAVLIALSFASAHPLAAQGRRFPINDDESKVAPYTLPDPLVRAGGGRIATAAQWRGIRRPELFEIFEREIYGKSPQRPLGLRFERMSVDPRALGGRATRKQVRVHFIAGRDEPYMDVLLYVPNARRGKVPAFLALTYGNHEITADTGVAISAHYLRDHPLPDSAHGVAPRGTAASRWPIDTILARGYALAAVYLGDLDPDKKDAVANGIRPWFLSPGEHELRDDEWGALASWGWGLSRALDYLERDPDVDARRVALVGHSRTGKAALWAGARDQRFAMVIANETGMGGAKLSRRNYGQTVIDINYSFPYWFARNFRKYNDREQELPVDQHELIALIAPRPVYVGAATDDKWADPKGMFLGEKGAEPVYRLLGARSLLPDSMPGVHQPTLRGPLGFHLRTGVHDVTDYDWAQFLAFADGHLKR
jgi:hypothetical protein